MLSLCLVVSCFQFMLSIISLKFNSVFIDLPVLLSCWVFSSRPLDMLAFFSYTKHLSVSTNPPMMLTENMHWEMKGNIILNQDHNAFNQIIIHKKIQIITEKQRNSQFNWHFIPIIKTTFCFSLETKLYIGNPNTTLDMN